MSTKGQLKGFLEAISKGAKFIKFNYTSAEVFSVVLKCKIKVSDTDNFYNDFTKHWIGKFSEFTHTAWIVRNCFPNLKRLAYRKTFWCHRSAQNKSKTSERTRNLGCKAKIDFRIKLINKNTEKNDADLKKGLNMNITIDFNHTHLIRTPESYNLLKTSTESDSEFYKYFNDGYTPSMAKSFHELILIERYGQESGHIQNASINPNLRHVIYIFQKKRPNKSLDSNHIIKRKIEALKGSGHIVKNKWINQFVVIITPLMRRVITEFSLERILVDVTPIHAGPFVMTLFVPTPVGSLPIACAIYTDRTVAVYSQLLLAISEAIETDLEKSFAPEIASLGNTIVKEALISIFCGITIKTDRFQMCKEFWEWLCDSDSNIDEANRHDILRQVKSLIYADSVDDACKIYFEMQSTEIMQPCLQKLETLWQDWEDWIATEEFRGKHIEAPIIFLKEFFIQKCKSFSFFVMMDVVTNIMECHFEKMITAYMNRGSIALHTKFLPKATFSSQSVQRVGPNEFIVPCEFKEGQFYRLSTDSLCCDCKAGIKGRICEHLTAVLNIMDCNYDYPPLSTEETARLLKIASDVTKIKYEIDNNLGEDEVPATDIPMPFSPQEEFVMEMKKEDLLVDPLDDNQNNESETIELKTQYEAAMKAVNDEFRRLNKLFRDNPNKANMETMTRLAKELAKIRPVEETDLSNIFVQMNNR